MAYYKIFFSDSSQERIVVESVYRGIKKEESTWKFTHDGKPFRDPIHEPSRFEIIPHSRGVVSAIINERELEKLRNTDFFKYTSLDNLSRGKRGYRFVSLIAPSKNHPRWVKIVPESMRGDKKRFPEKSRSITFDIRSRGRIIETIFKKYNKIFPQREKESKPLLLVVPEKQGELLKPVRERKFPRNTKPRKSPNRRKIPRSRAR